MTRTTRAIYICIHAGTGQERARAAQGRAGQGGSGHFSIKPIHTCSVMPGLRWIAWKIYINYLWLIEKFTNCNWVGQPTPPPPCHLSFLHFHSFSSSLRTWPAKIMDGQLHNMPCVRPSVCPSVCSLWHCCCCCCSMWRMCNNLSIVYCVRPSRPCWPFSTANMHEVN